MTNERNVNRYGDFDRLVINMTSIA